MAEVQQKPTQMQDIVRVNRYVRNEQLFQGNHLDAFNAAVGDNQMKRDYQRLRYVAVNFAGMLSRLSADTLFGFEEYPRISFTSEELDKWFEQFSFANDLPIQMYESALENSFRGDAVFRLRSENNELVIEDINPEIWFPIYDSGNVRKAPSAHVLQWKTSQNILVDPSGKSWAITVQETHRKGSVSTKAFRTNEKGETMEILTDQQLKALGMEAEVKTNVNEMLVFHIPNTRINNTIFGMDDYHDLLSLMYAINNRLTKIDNVLDKHGDPVLAVPEGVLDDDGEVKKQAFGLIEIASGEGMNKPEYIVWDAKLDASFAVIDKMMEMLFMTSETSPAAFGLDKEGQADSGRALKYKMLRTLAKKHRKQAYFDVMMKRMFFTAMNFAKANGLTVGGMKFPNVNPEFAQIEWQDGVINDEVEMLSVETQKMDAGLTSRVEVLMRMEGLNRKQAEARVKEADAEKAARAPVFNANPMNINDPENKNGDGNA